MNLVNSIKETLRKRKNMNDTIHQLNKLTDAELRDIGITRSQINSIARGVIDFHRAVRDNK